MVPGGRKPSSVVNSLLNVNLREVDPSVVDHREHHNRKIAMTMANSTALWPLANPNLDVPNLAEVRSAAFDLQE